jgi:hypothetical protein
MTSTDWILIRPDVEAFHLIPDAGARNAQQPRRFGLIAAGLAQRSHKSLLLKIVDANW